MVGYPGTGVVHRSVRTKNRGFHDLILVAFITVLFGFAAVTLDLMTGKYELIFQDKRANLYGQYDMTGCILTL
jgi:hypothetical protein